MRLNAIHTPATPGAIAGSLVRGWWRLLQTRPTDAAIRLLLIQIIFECGWGEHLYSFNVGNAKSLQRSGDWCFRTCGELLTPEAAADLLRRAQPRADDHSKLNVELGDLVQTKAGLRQKVTLHPDHPGSCFRAFITLDEGVRDYLSMMVDRFGEAFDLVPSGDIPAVGAALKRANYFTDEEDHYVGQMVKLSKQRNIRELPIDLSPPAADTTAALAAAQADALRDLTWSLIKEPDK